jgi:hypothetical protein
MSDARKRSSSGRGAACCSPHDAESGANRGVVPDHVHPQSMRELCDQAADAAEADDA